MDRSIYKWHIMEEGFIRLKRHFDESAPAEGEPDPPFNGHDRDRLERTMYRIFTSREGDYCPGIYHNYEQLFLEYLQDTVLPAITQKHGELMLKELVKRWSNHETMMSTLSFCFFHLKHHIERNSLPSLSVVGINCFRDQVYNKIYVQAKDAILSLITDEKEGKEIDRPLLKDAISIYKAVGSGTYDDDFEAFLLANYHSDNAPSSVLKYSSHYVKTPTLIKASTLTCEDSKEYLKNCKDIVARDDAEDKLSEQKQDMPMHKYNEGGKKRKVYQIEAIDGGYCWKGLQNGPLIEIAQRMPNFEDFEALHLVCGSWNSILQASNCKFLDGGHLGRCSPQVPWLMMAEQERVQQHGCKDDKSSMRLFFYSLSFRRVRELVVRLPPELDIGEEHLSDCRLYSSHGWLLIITKGLKMSLFSPLHGNLHDTLAKGVKKFTLSASPCTESYTVMLAYGTDKLAFWRPGDEEWTCEPPYDRTYRRIEKFPLWCVVDVTFYQGHQYALCSKRQIYAIDQQYIIMSSGEPCVSRCWIASVYPNESYESCLWKAYFVVAESSKKLFVVERLCHYRPRPSDGKYFTNGFEVSEIVVPLTHRRDGTHVKKVSSLDNISFFIGSKEAFAIEVPQDWVDSYYYGCKPNCIYFTDDNGKDMGVYNMEDGTIHRHFHGLSPDHHSRLLWLQPRC